MQEVKAKRPQVNASCIGCGACVAISPDAFEFDQSGLSKAKKCEKYDGMFVDEAISACPVNAITWI